MTTSDINGIIVGALIAILGASLLSIFRYFVMNRVESKQWERDQRAQVIDRIDVAASEVTKRASMIMSFTFDGMPRDYKRAQGEIRASFTRWDMLLNPHCTEEEKNRIWKEMELMFLTRDSLNEKVIATVIEITHAVKERLINDNKRPWWKFRK